jgi:hypothetical protein
MSRQRGATYLVFISHSTKDRWIARQMAAIIERKARRYGVRTFLDEVDLEGGDRIAERSKRISMRARSS